MGNRDMLNTPLIRNIALIISLLLISVSISFASDCSNPLGEDMRACAFKDAEKADAKLNTTYSELTRLLHTDKKSSDQLLKAQRSWIKFRDEECLTRYIFMDESRDGSLISIHCHTELTKTRIKQLQGLRTYL